CFDKVAKMLGFPYPGGPHIERVAKEGSAKSIPMPQMIESRSQLAFSYSGLKTHMVNLIQRSPAEWMQENMANICASFQEEALSQIVRKLAEATRLKPQARKILIAGVVAANQKFRALLSERVSIEPIFPDFRFCSDNGAMIAAYAYHVYQAQPNADAFAWDRSWDAYSRYAF